MDLDIDTERWLKSRCEELDLLHFAELAGVRESGLESLLVFEDRSCALVGGQFAEQVCLEGRTETEVEQLGESPPRWCALVALHLDVPELHLQGCRRLSTPSPPQ